MQLIRAIQLWLCAPRLHMAWAKMLFSNTDFLMVTFISASLLTKFINKDRSPLPQISTKKEAKLSQKDRSKLRCSAQWQH